MSGVTETKRAIVDAQCYGKGQRILVDKIEKNRSWEKVRIKCHGRERLQRTL